MLFELIWSYRFLYRDLNDLLSNNRKLESHFQFVLQRKTRAVQAVLDGIAAGSGLTIEARDAEPVATAMVVVLTYWLSFEYVRDPRRALEPESGERGALARRLPRALPAAALPRRRPARAPARARRALHDDAPEETDTWPNGPPFRTTPTPIATTPRR